jgi:hypothetical protein
MCRIASLFLLQNLKGSMSGDARHFNNIETRVLIKYFFFLQGQGAAGNSRLLTETLVSMHHRMLLSKTGWPSLNVVIFSPMMRPVLETQNSDHPGDY